MTHRNFDIYLPRGLDRRIKGAIATTLAKARLSGKAALYWLGHMEFKAVCPDTLPGQVALKRVDTLGGHLVGVYTPEYNRHDMLADIQATTEMRFA